jgi:hypothetical protein
MEALKVFYMSLSKLTFPPACTVQDYGSSEGVLNETAKAHTHEQVGDYGSSAGVLHEPDQAHSLTSRYKAGYGGSEGVPHDPDQAHLPTSKAMEALKVFFMSLTKLTLTPSMYKEGYGSSKGVISDPV